MNEKLLLPPSDSLEKLGAGLALCRVLQGFMSLGSCIPGSRGPSEWPHPGQQKVMLSFKSSLQVFREAQVDSRACVSSAKKS